MRVRQAFGQVSPHTPRHAFDTKGVYVTPGATPGDQPNTWWIYYTGTNVEHDSNPADIHSDGGIGRFLLVLE